MKNAKKRSEKVKGGEMAREKGKQRNGSDKQRQIGELGSEK